MKAVRLYAAGDLRVETVAAPGPPAPRTVTLRIMAAGICGSDLHNFRTGQWITRSPSIPGHELIGRVIAVGEGVDDFVIGDRVVADSRFWCGECPACMNGNCHLCSRLGFVGEVCDGGFAEEVNLPHRLIHALPHTLSDVAAVMVEPVTVALHAVNRLAVPRDCPVLIAGCGPIGGLAALVLSEHGHSDIRVADHNEERLKRVCDVTGAAAVTLDPSSAGAGISHAIEATGSPRALEQLLKAVEPGARISLVGIMHGRLDLDPNLLVEREISLIGCHAFRDELPSAIAFLETCDDRARRLADQEVPLDEVPEAYRRLIAGQATGLKTIVKP